MLTLKEHSEWHEIHKATGLPAFICFTIVTIAHQTAAMYIFACRVARRYLILLCEPNDLFSAPIECCVDIDQKRTPC